MTTRTPSVGHELVARGAEEPELRRHQPLPSVARSCPPVGRRTPVSGCLIVVQSNNQSTGRSLRRIGSRGMEQGTLDRPPSLTDAVVAHIRDAIIRGAYAPGQPLTEASCPRSWAPRAGTVREALRELAQPGAGRRAAPTGAPSVSTLTARDAEEVYTLRAALESFAAQLAVERGHLDEAALAHAGPRLGGHRARRRRRRRARPWSRPTWTSTPRCLALSGHDLLIEHLAAIQVHSRRRALLQRPLPAHARGRGAAASRPVRRAAARAIPTQVSLAVDQHITGPAHGYRARRCVRASGHARRGRPSEDS